ncbi:proteoglycan 4-like isoform X2 [Eurosta solidaginis]|uniref:proteoglycan 4-like isoform X2 n=1 Tax=Eurosta solidaginis TaxID=178769 RepID=UPI0035313FE4
MDKGCDFTIVEIKCEKSDSEEDEMALAELKNQLINEKKISAKKAVELQEIPIKTEATLSQQNENKTEAMRCHLVDEFIIYELGEANNSTNESNAESSNVAHQTSIEQISTPLRKDKLKPTMLSETVIDPQTFRKNIAAILKKKLQPKQKIIKSSNSSDATIKKSLKSTEKCEKVPTTDAETTELPSFGTELTVTEISEETYNNRNKPTTESGNIYDTPNIQTENAFVPCKIPTTLNKKAPKLNDTRNIPTPNAIVAQKSTTSTSSTITSSTTTPAQQMQQIKVAVKRFHYSTKRQTTPLQLTLNEAKQILTNVKLPVRPSLATNCPQPGSTLLKKSVQPRPILPSNSPQPVLTLPTNSPQPRTTLLINSVQPTPTLPSNSPQPIPTLPTNSAQPRPTLLKNSIQPQPTLTSYSTQPTSIFPSHSPQPIQTNFAQPRPTLPSNFPQSRPTLPSNSPQPIPTLPKNSAQPRPTLLKNAIQPKPTLPSYSTHPTSILPSNSPQPIQTNSTHPRPTLPSNSQQSRPTLPSYSTQTTSILPSNSPQPIQTNSAQPRPTLPSNTPQSRPTLHNKRFEHFQNSNEEPAELLNNTSNITNVNLKCECFRESTDKTSDLYTKLDLKDFFGKMFEETRKLSFQKRKTIKAELLKAVCKAEEDAEAGMLCANCYTVTSAPMETKAALERCNTEASSDSTESGDATKYTKYTKRFKNSWLREDCFKNWLQPVDSSRFQAKCTVCDKVLSCGKSELKKHSKTLWHRRREQMQLYGTILETSKKSRLLIN